jgi:hypothetical protein
MRDTVTTIRYGMFIMPFHDPAKPLGQYYDEDLELIVRTDQGGVRSRDLTLLRGKVPACATTARSTR